MPTIPSRELTIAYGSYSVNPDGAITFAETFDAESVEFEFNVTGSDESGFAAACIAAETAFRKPFQDLVITQGGSTLKTLKHSTGTGLEIMPTISKADHVADTGRSRHYHVRIVCGRPADNVTTSGLREWSLSVAKDPAGRKLASFSGVWTAISSTLARAGYEAGIETKAQAILTSLGGTWELIGEDPAAASYNDLTLAFTRRYHQVAFGQAGGGDNSSIVEQQMRVAVRSSSDMQGFGSPPQPGGYGNQGGGGGQAFPLIEVSGSYACYVPFSAANGVASLAGVYATIRPFVLQQMAAAGGGKGFALTEERPEYEPDNNRILVTLAGLAVPASGVLRRSWSYQEATDTGIVLVPVWGSSPYSYFEYPGPARRIATVRLMEETASGGNGNGGSNAAAGGGGGGGNTIQVGGNVPGFNFGFGDLFGNPLGFGGESDSTGSTGGFVDYFGSRIGIGSQLSNGVDFTMPPGSSGGAGGGGSGGGASLGGGDTNWRVIHRPDVTTEQFAIGLSSPIVVTRKTQLAVFQYIEPARGGSGASTAGPAQTPGRPDPPNGTPSNEPIAPPA